MPSRASVEGNQADGSLLHIEELAHRTWQGERIAREGFFYDPAQMKPVKRS